MSVSLYHLLLLPLLFFPLSHCATYYGKFCADLFASGSLNHGDIAHELENLASEAPHNDGFSISSYGTDGGQTIYGVAQCLAGTSGRRCSTCLADAANQLPIECPAFYEAANGIIWYDLCFMHYSYTNFTGHWAIDGYQVIRETANGANASDADAFDKKAFSLMKKLIARAVVPENDRRMSKGEVFYKAASQTIYGLAECRRDISPENCFECLNTYLFSQFPTYCWRQSGCAIYNTGCFLQYEVYPFFHAQKV